MDQLETKINAGDWTLFDKVMYGGLGYGAFCLPKNFFKVIMTVIFPPLGEIINMIEDTMSDVYPYVSWGTLAKLLELNNLNRIIYSFVLTSMFYIPGLIYTLSNIKCDDVKEDDSIIKVRKY